LSSPPKVIIVSLNITFGLKNVQLFYSLSLQIVIALLKYRQKYYLERAGKTVLNETDDRPKINLEEIKEVSFLKFFAKKSTTDFTFYPENEE